MRSISGSAVIGLLVVLLVVGAVAGWLSLLLTTGAAQAATSLDSTTTFDQDKCTVCSFDYSVATSGENLALVVVATHHPQNGQSITGVTYGGQALTLARTDTNSTKAETSIWYKINPLTSENVVAVTFSAESRRLSLWCIRSSTFTRSTP